MKVVSGVWVIDTSVKVYVVDKMFLWREKENHL